MTRFSVSFNGAAPEQLNVGDKLLFQGEATVREISGDLIDITCIGRDPEFTVGDFSVELVANRAQVARPHRGAI